VGPDEHDTAGLALAVIAGLAEEIGPRRPTSAAEHRAAEFVSSLLREAGAEPSIEAFYGYETFARVYGPLAALALAPGLLPRSATKRRVALGALAAGLLAAEGGLVRTPLSDAISSAPSPNVVATVEPRESPVRALCLMAHLDTSRSGLLFDPRFAGAMRLLTVGQSVAITALVAEPLLRRSWLGRVGATASRLLCALGLGLLVEREVRGEDVPGANDNASGAGVVVQLAAEAAAQPLAHTRLVVLIAGCEESGLLGTRAFLDAHDTSGWLFLNFDGVGAPATLRYLEREGIGRTWPADHALVELARQVEQARPELRFAAADRPLGLTFDATAVLARGGRAMTLVAGDGGRIPNYHQPSDDLANIDRERLALSLEVGRELISMVDRGAAD
jgi:hypothetical protein